MWHFAIVMLDVIVLSVVMLSIIMLSMAFFHYYARCHFAGVSLRIEWHFAVVMLGVILMGVRIRHDRKLRPLRGLERDVSIPVQPVPFLMGW